MTINVNITRLKLPLEEKEQYFQESANMGEIIKDVNIDEEVFPQPKRDVEFTNISVIIEDMKKG